ncbi:MAG: GIY-YIG nuclease family protein [Porticoccaceae bacterium]|jgi:putative endonuclease|nr:GIY-YIG nuclease family protein [Porticoccaceae bacterium]MDG1310699.1 GIY-YIG nuclease family protein [Porticoccaceae bacterium]
MTESPREPGQWYVYIVRASDQTLYTGITTDPERRLAEHQSGKAGAKYFRGRSAIEMVHIETGYNRSSAAIREAAIKKLSRVQKWALINN